MHKQNMILRHKLFDRLCHWFVVATGLVTFLTGFAFFFPSFQWLGSIAGTPQMARFVHPIAGLMMCLPLMVMLVRYYHHNKWEKNDLTWMLAIKDVMFENEDKIPAIGHYNPGQKVLFRTFVVTSIALTVTGIMMWQPYFAPYFDSIAIQWAILIHAVCAVIMLIFVIVHFWMATWVEGSVAGMLYGYVSRAWCKKHHPNMLNDPELKTTKQEKH
ncbi:formate dehydrogenase subunit gamma [Shewanella sp. D64]|uniref:formate dehydrogenase subunit gamma n=1 Tax=unclassified Shewanella TaxID=196818 RepID=UPI0022BA3383|nr:MULTISPECIES: formate dehydrogenase subunit gamma [unclassified Shewanella]MEC4724389.1 formate dehydrogenase subunit gamma [Shewanella sp. D64]MEC4736834.1 formate dehydrogenase subunit gamma [Shewanella sp. E94]WBJ94507.1 formate dehydrogenase subunit gamma [Shewanella sp. MTB7]